MVVENYKPPLSVIKEEPIFPSTADIARLVHHIQSEWHGLSRGLRQVTEALSDVKLGEDSTHSSPVYISASEDLPRVQRIFEKSSTTGKTTTVRLKVLPSDPARIEEHGLLFLPGRYVVPGGRFNEMYGWDSYFIALGLLRQGRVPMARAIADQCLYQVEHYGTVLTANRTYYLTRSHPPFLGRLVLAVYRASGDITWLRRALPLLEKFYYYWTVPPHHVSGINLSRYYDFAQGPAPEVVRGEVDENGHNHYERLRMNLAAGGEYVQDASSFLDPETGALTPHAYHADRSMRESGFDVSGRFGFANLDVLDILPVCLNTLLWKLELDIAKIREFLDATATLDVWLDRARQRAAIMNAHFWDEEAGMFFDYDGRAVKRRAYPFATTFWPMWAGLASREQAARIVSRLPEFEARGGLLTSLHLSGCQWDKPFGWAPLNYLAVMGLHRYGYRHEARRIARRFVTLVINEFRRTGLLFEKYDVENMTSDVQGKIIFGYPTNEPGFGWTNACTMELLDYLGCLGDLDVEQTFTSRIQLPPRTTAA
ncbi:MAG: trehalase family glycosidase [Prosthecobacter sp.]|uniref:trehalase family glycosidase n=1 Tax=Prosthecobacter sp. TaxID=1965333 RepID=UPI003BAE79AA